MDLPAPFGPYELQMRIATGGMAEVYLARSFGVAGFEKRLVVKRIRSELERDPKFISMFIHEAKIGVRLDHPNIVQVYELGKALGSYYIAMEHLHGQDLTRLVKALRAQGRKLPLPLAVWIVAETCRGLAYAHGRSDSAGRFDGLVHRDVSPHNIQLTFGGEVKILDFGIARLLNSPDPPAPEAAPQQVAGKFAYMSPEQVRGDPVDHRTDVFSAGIVLWELIVGHRLYTDPDPAVKLQKVRDAVVPHPRDEGVAIDDALWAVLSKALAARPQDRTSSAALLEEDLRAWLFEVRSRVGPSDLVALLQEVFPQEAAQRPEIGVSLVDLADEVGRLDAPDPEEADATPTMAKELPGRLRKSGGERKQVTALFIDMDGLTELSGRIDPESLTKRHFRLLRWMSQLAGRYGGVVQRVIDDHILILFGIPRTRTDDLDRALECALDLQRRTSELSTRIGAPLQMTIGIHQGEVVVGDGSRKLRVEARGDTTRFARRLSAVADHGEVLVSERVVHGLGGTFSLERGPAVANRGGKAADPSWRITGRRVAVRAAGKGPWLRRGDELQVIREALVGLGEGKGQVIAVTGGVGSGKSRLIRELLGVASRSGLLCCSARCTPGGPREALAQLLRDVMGLPADAPAASIAEASERLVQLGLDEGRTRMARALLSGEIGGDEAWAVVAAALAGVVRETPVLVVLDDVQLLGGRDQEQLARLLTATEGPRLAILSVRGPLPEALIGHARPLELGGFPPEAQRRLVENLLEASAISEPLWDLVARSCEGNPLYVEALVDTLRERGGVKVVGGEAQLVAGLDEGDLPPTLAGLISARIDALDPASKGILQLAAICGNTFGTRLLAEAAGLDDPSPMVAELVGQGLIVRDDGSGRGEWAFASDLVREAALRGSLGVQRRDYHRLVAAAIEALYHYDLSGWLDDLALHCERSGRMVDAARYACRAGERAEGRHELERARDLYAQGLHYVRGAPQTPDEFDARTQGEATLLLRLGKVHGMLGESQGALKHLHLALEVSADHGLTWIEVRAHLEIARQYLDRGKHSLAKAHLSQVRALARAENDPDLEIEAVEASAHLAHELGRNDEAESTWRAALTLAEGRPAALARCRLGLASLCLRLGRYDEARPLLDAALEATRAAGDRILEGRVLNNQGLLHALIGETAQALACYRTALEVRQGIGYLRGVVINLHNIGDLHFDQEEWARAGASFARSREIAAKMGWERGVVLNDVYLGYLAARGGDPSGLPSVAQATDRARKLSDGEMVVTGLWLQARILAERGEPGPAKALAEEGLTEAHRWDIRSMTEVLEELLVEVSGEPSPQGGAPALRG